MYKKFFNIPTDKYKYLEFDVPRQIEFITVNPGGQVTGSFHKKVLSDIKEWYYPFVPLCAQI